MSRWRPMDQAGREGFGPDGHGRWRVARQAWIDGEAGDKGELTSAEEEERAHLRRDNRVLRAERELLGKTAASFAKESR